MTYDAPCASTSAGCPQKKDFKSRCQTSKQVVEELSARWSRLGLQNKPIRGHFNIVAYPLSSLKTLKLLGNVPLVGLPAAMLYQVIDKTLRPPRQAGSPDDAVPVKPLNTLFRHEGIVLELDSHRVTITIELFDEGLDMATHYWGQGTREEAWSAALKAVSEKRDPTMQQYPIVRMAQPQPIKGGIMGKALVDLLQQSIDRQLRTGYNLIRNNCQHLAVRLRRELTGSAATNTTTIGATSQRVNDTSGASSNATATTTDMDSFLYCPLSHELMTDPVVAGDGYTYHRSSIEQYTQHYYDVYDDGDGIRGLVPSPITSQPMDSTILLTNHPLKQRLEEGITQRQLLTPQV